MSGGGAYGVLNGVWVWGIRRARVRGMSGCGCRLRVAWGYVSLQEVSKMRGI